MSIKREEDAEVVARELATDWMAWNCFFMGAFDRETDEFATPPNNWLNRSPLSAPLRHVRYR